MNNIVQLLSRLGMARIAAMGVVAALMLGLFAFLILRATSPQMAPLYTGLSLEDSSAIVSELQRQNVGYELRGDGDTILVARDQITTLRMALAQNGLPQRGQVGYEIFDQQSALGATSFVQNINNVRALEGELARTIGALARIKSARVHLVLPERQLFQKEAKDPTASIMLSVRGQLSGGEIRAIQHLVASAVEGLTPNHVSIVDDTGTLLASGAGNDAADALAGEAEERTLAVEQRLRTRIEDLLDNIVGPGRARVQVSAELDLQRSTKTSETFNPDGQVVRSSQTRDVANIANAPSMDGATSVSAQLPGAGGGNGAGPTTEQGKTSEETVNYEISKTTETAVSEAGGIKRLSVAVVVDGSYLTDASGNATYQPRSQQEIDQINALVRSAAGIVDARGDQVQVVNMQFAARPSDAAAIGTGSPGLFDFTRDDLMNLAQMVVTLVVGLALVLFVMRPLLKRVLTPEAPPRLALSQVEEPAPDAPAPNAGEAETAMNLAWIDNAKSVGAVQAQTLKTVGTLVDDNPRQAATIIRDWLSTPA